MAYKVPIGLKKFKDELNEEEKVAALYEPQSFDSSKSSLTPKETKES